MCRSSCADERSRSGRSSTGHARAASVVTPPGECTGRLAAGRARASGERRGTSSLRASSHGWPGPRRAFPERGRCRLTTPMMSRASSDLRRCDSVPMMPDPKALTHSDPSHPGSSASGARRSFAQLRRQLARGSVACWRNPVNARARGRSQPPLSVASSSDAPPQPSQRELS